MLVITGPLLFALTYLVRVDEAGQGDARDGPGPRRLGDDGHQRRPDDLVHVRARRRARRGGGVIYTLYIGTSRFELGFRLGLFAFTAAVLGGIGNLTGAVLGGILLGLIAAYNEGFGDARWTTTIIFSILILILVFRPVGPARRADAGGPVSEPGQPAQRPAPGRLGARLRSEGGRERAAAALSCCPASRSFSSSRTRSGRSSLIDLDIVIVMAVYVMLALGLNIVVGYAGLLDLGYVAFFALGAYTLGWFGSDALLRARTFHFGSVRQHGAARDPPQLLDRRDRSPAAIAGDRGRDHRLADAAPARRLPRDRHARLRRDHPGRLPQRRRVAGADGRAGRARRSSTSTTVNLTNGVRGVTAARPARVRRDA